MSKEFLYEIRAHHGMCLAFFEGKGYSSEFVRHMQKMQTDLEENPMVCIKKETDCICEYCPNKEKGQCSSADKVAEYDRQVLEHCGIFADVVMPFYEFRQKVEEHILRPGKREEICGDCQWNEVCKNHGKRNHED